MNKEQPYTIITGAGNGIGKELALKIGKNKNVVCISKSESCKRTANLIGKNAKFLISDLSIIAEVKKGIVDLLDSDKISVDTFIHCAGTIGESGPLEKTNLENWEKVFNVNLFSGILFVKELLPVFKKQKFGKFIFFSGGGSSYGYSVLPQYSASKTSLVRFVENLEIELSNYENISSHIIAPGAVNTEMFKEVRKHEEDYGKSSEIRSFSETEDVVDFVDFLVNHNCKKLSGRLIHIRDDWKEKILNEVDISDQLWKLRRIE